MWGTRGENQVSWLVLTRVADARALSRSFGEISELVRRESGETASWPGGRGATQLAAVSAWSLRPAREQGAAAASLLARLESHQSQGEKKTLVSSKWTQKVLEQGTAASLTRAQWDSKCLVTTQRDAGERRKRGDLTDGRRRRGAPPAWVFFLFFIFLMLGRAAATCRLLGELIIKCEDNLITAGKLQPPLEEASTVRMTYHSRNVWKNVQGGGCPLAAPLIHQQTRQNCSNASLMPLHIWYEMNKRKKIRLTKGGECMKWQREKRLNVSH